MICPQKFFSGDYLFVYDAGEKNVVGLIYHTPDSEYTTEAYMKNDDVVDTIGYNMMEAMEHKNDNICDDSDYICGEEHAMDDDT